MKVGQTKRDPYRILIVDDDAAICDLLSELLQSPSRSIEVRDTPRAALEFLQRNPVDLAFVDLVMPGMKGTELAKKIKERCPQAHIVICTGYLTEASAAEAQAVPVDCLLEKPLDLGEVLELADSYSTE
jgi:two-component system response regulator RegA